MKHSPVLGANRARILEAVVIAAFLFILPGTAVSQPDELNPYDDSNGMPVCTATSDQTTPAIASDGSGGSIIAWNDERSGNSDIYIQRTSLSGSLLWLNNGIAICTEGSTQELPQIVSDGTGGAIVVWQDYRNGNFDIYAQRVNSSGEAIWNTNGVPVCTAAFDQFNISVISDGFGGAILTWEDNRSNVVNCPDIYAQRVNQTGSMLWTANGVSVCNEASAQHGPRLVGDGSGGAFITWYDQRAGDYDIYTQRVASGGAVQWTTNGVATCTMATDQLMPDICSDGAGGVIIAWHDFRSTTDFNIYAQRQGPSGAIVWAVDGVVMNNNVGYDQINTKIVEDGVGGAIMVWQDYVTGTTADVYAQRVASAGAVLWTATGVIICTAAGDQIYPQIVSDGNSGAFVTWEDYRSVSTSDIYAQRIAADASIYWPATGYLICGADSLQSGPAMISDGNQGAIVAWQDHRNSSWDIYAQGFDTSGTGTEGGSTPTGSQLILHPAYPNPSTAMVGFSFSLPGSGAVELAVYDITGRMVATVISGEMLAGTHQASWNGASAAAGVYFCRLSFDGMTQTSQVVVLR
jgi:predicted lipoprotein with Yx(FWY)xxD motif